MIVRGGVAGYAPGMTEAHEAVAAYWAAAQSRDWGAFANLVAEQVVYEAPQFRERVRGRTAYVRIRGCASSTSTRMAG